MFSKRAQRAINLQLYLKHFYKPNYIETYSNKLKQRPYRHNRTSYHEAIT